MPRGPPPLEVAEKLFLMASEEQRLCGATNRPGSGCSEQAILGPLLLTGYFWVAACTLAGKFKGELEKSHCLHLPFKA